MEDIDDNNINNDNAYVNCRASDIIRLLKTKTDRKNIAKELSMYVQISVYIYISRRMKKDSIVHFFFKLFQEKKR